MIQLFEEFKKENYIELYGILLGNKNEYKTFDDIANKLNEYFKTVTSYKDYKSSFLQKHMLKGGYLNLRIEFVDEIKSNFIPYFDIIQIAKNVDLHQIYVTILHELKHRERLIQNSFPQLLKTTIPSVVGALLRLLPISTKIKDNFYISIEEEMYAHAFEIVMYLIFATKHTYTEIKEIFESKNKELLYKEIEQYKNSFSIDVLEYKLTQQFLRFEDYTKLDSNKYDKFKNICLEILDEYNDIIDVVQKSDLKNMSEADFLKIFKENNKSLGDKLNIN